MPATKTDGFLLLDKPAGVTSHDVVAAVRRVTGARAGHTGTLDPFATGLLVVLVGAATRIARYVPDEPKVYDATIRFGAATDTDDATGSVIVTAELPDESAVVAAIARLTGELMQTPPAYSAKHVGGRRAYAMARRGAEVALPPAPVRVDKWEVLAHDDTTWRVRITCGRGTYVRALARDLGLASGSVAHLAALRRVRVGPFHVHDAVGLAPLQTREIAPLPAIDAISQMPRETLTAEQLRDVSDGRRVNATVSGDLAALVDNDGALVAVADRAGDAWQPRVVLRHA